MMRRNIKKQTKKLNAKKCLLMPLTKKYAIITAKRIYTFKNNAKFAA